MSIRLIEIMLKDLSKIRLNEHRNKERDGKKFTAKENGGIRTKKVDNRRSKKTSTK